MNNIAPTLQKCWRHKIVFEIILKMLKQANFFYSQPSRLPKGALAKFYLSTAFGLSFKVSSVPPYGSMIFYAYLITKIGNHNFKHFKLFFEETMLRNCQNIEIINDLYEI